MLQKAPRGMQAQDGGWSSKSLGWQGDQEPPVSPASSSRLHCRGASTSQAVRSSCKRGLSAPSSGHLQHHTLFPRPLSCRCSVHWGVPGTLRETPKASSKAMKSQADRPWIKLRSSMLHT